MRWFFAPGVLIAVTGSLLVTRPAQADPDQTVRSADQVLHEVMAIPARRIPETLLAEAQGVAIIPDVIKIGFVAGIRRGHGVVLIRDDQGNWTWPQFVTLTGGSFGWQAGVQGSDVVLVFMTKKSVEGLLRGKFTVGADASVAAGPVGRNAAAATDARLKAEILSYSRSRGLFVGLALDGSAIEIDDGEHLAYYGSPSGQPPARMPESAVKLHQDLAQMTPPGSGTAVPLEGPTLAVPNPATLRQLLGKNATQLYAVVDASWQKYLALPPEVIGVDDPPRLDALQRALQQYDRVAQAPQYQALVTRPEFQATHESLREYIRALSETARPQIALPPPPVR